MPMNILRRDVNFPQILNFPNLVKVSLLKCPVYYQCYSVAFLSNSFMPVYFMYWDCIPGVRIFGLLLYTLKLLLNKTQVQ